MITLSNGHSFEHMAASGALGFDGRGWPWEQPLRWAGFLRPKLFTVVLKTLTRHPRRGNLRWWSPFRTVRPLNGGAVNAVGLTNPGIEWWCKEIGPMVDFKKQPLVASILSDDSEELTQMARMLNAFDFLGIEINASCPNTESETWKTTEKVIEGCQRVKAATRFPIILKLSVVHDIQKILPALKGVVEAVSINTVPWKTMFPDRTSPLAHFGGGGVSGKVTQSFVWNFLQRIQSISSIPVIGSAIWDFEDIARVRALGAQAISFGTLFLWYPWLPTWYVQKDRKMMIH